MSEEMTAEEYAEACAEYYKELDKKNKKVEAEAQLCIQKLNEAVSFFKKRDYEKAYEAVQRADSACSQVYGYCQQEDSCARTIARQCAIEEHMKQELMEELKKEGWTCQQ